MPNIYNRAIGLGIGICMTESVFLWNHTLALSCTLVDQQVRPCRVVRLSCLAGDLRTNDIDWVSYIASVHQLSCRGKDNKRRVFRLKYLCHVPRSHTFCNQLNQHNNIKSLITVQFKIDNISTTISNIAYNNVSKFTVLLLPTYLQNQSY